jgi:hypothetical protein
VKRRLYFLLPDALHTRSVVRELEAGGIERRRMHVIAGEGADLKDLPSASRNQRRDLSAKLETVLWNGNLSLFFAALLVLGVLVFLDTSPWWLLLPAAVMLATFLAGLEFTGYLPNVHLSEFTDALHHQEILLMVDVPADQLARVEETVRRHHPEAVTGGTCWHVDAMQA